MAFVDGATQGNPPATHMAPCLGSRFLAECQRAPEALAYAFVSGDGRVTEMLTRDALSGQVQRLAAWLMGRGRPGDRVLLAMPAGLDFVRAFWACMLAGRVAVPIPAPEATRLRHAAPRLHGVLVDCGAALVLTTHLLREAAQALPDASAWGAAEWVALPQAGELAALPAGTAWPPATELAYLQYTSGSTGAPRGVCLSHANVLANAQAVSVAVGASADSRVLNWLPHFHDYGLVAGIVAPLLCGASSHLMSPLSFVRRPLMWLDVIAAQGITHTGAPDSGLRLCLQALQGAPARARLDTLVGFSCGAEPIRAETVESVLALLGPAGLRPQAFMPFYGLAESVLGVSGPSPAAPPRIVDVASEALGKGRLAPAPVAAQRAGTIRLVSCGRPLTGLQCLVVDPATAQVLPEGCVGELWVQGSSVGLGYWRQPQATDEVFGAHLADGRGPFLRTGDLAALHEGELLVTGRLKDLVIVHGANHYPHDLEWSAERAHAQLRVGHGAAFSVAGEEGEELVLVLEVERRHRSPDAEAIFEAVRAAIAREHGLPVHALALVRAGTLARTSSGKIQRGRCREAYLAGTLPLLATSDKRVDAMSAPGAEGAGADPLAHRVAPRDALEREVHAIWADVLGHSAFGVLDDFFALGGNSLRMTQVLSRIHGRLGVALPLGEVFEHSSVAALAVQVAQGRASRPGEHDAAPAIAAVPRSPAMPVSLSQRRMWVIQRFEPASTAYNVPIALRLRGPLDAALFQQAIDAMVQRHEGLRTAFVAGETEPLQVIAPDLRVPLELIDLQTLPAAQRGDQARALVADRAARPFDLSAPPLHRVTLIRLDERDQVLLWVAHHAITDNWAVVLLMRETLQAYEALAAGHAPAGAAPAIQYADYAVWQRSPGTAAARQVHLAYWCARLQGLPDLDLPTDFARTASVGFHGARVSADLPLRLRQAVLAFGAQAGATPFIVYFSAFALLLSRLAGNEDVGVGIPIANRHREAAEALMGTLVNTLVMRTNLSGDPSFDALVARVRADAMAAYAHQEAPYDELIDALGHDRIGRPEGPVRVLFNVLNAPVGDLSFTDLQVEEFDFDRRAVQFDLSMHIDTEFAHRIHLDYAGGLYTAATAQRLLESFLSLLERALAQPARPVSELEMVSQSQMALLHAWNGDSTPLPADALVHRYVALDEAAMAARVAVVDAAGRNYTFADVDALSNALAHQLRARGIGRGARVGLCVGRSPQMLLAQLGVMKAGASYVPLDPAYPAERLRYMAVDAGLALLLVGADAQGIVDELGLPRAAVEDWLAPKAVEGLRGPLAPDATLDAGPEDEAYLIYTSGSTGQPKGVIVPHRGVVNFLMGMENRPGLGPRDCLVAITSPSFDPSVLDLMLPLRVRARLVIASQQQAQDPRALRTLLEDCGATLLQATPSAWRQLIEVGWRGSPDFRALIGGEALPPVLAERLMKRTAQLWNIYGPTETTVWTTAWRVRAPREGIAIGRPIPNTRVWVLDPLGHPCPIGVPGELYVGGAGVTAGYHDRTALTAERFVPDPFSDTPGARMYRSGDLGRWRHDGELEHLGRADHQVKLRGHRIEMGEIEAALLDHAGVAHCVAVTCALGEEDVRLVAYYVTHEGGTQGLRGLREHLRARLPDYMVPQHFVALGGLPQLPNGKVDRAALPKLDPEALRPQAGSRQPHSRPQTRQEKEVAAIWGELLGTNDVRRHDNFFDLGGHSLLATRAAAIIEARLGLKVEPKRLIFESLQQIASPANG